MLDPRKGGVMENELLLSLLVFAGCAALGGFMARVIIRCAVAAIVGLGIYAVLAHAMGGAANSISRVIGVAVGLCSALYSLIEGLVHAPGVIGLVIGVMAGLHVWKVERERDHGIVRYPRYPSPE